MNPLYIAIAIVVVILAALFWWIAGDAHDPLDTLDGYEGLVRRCAKADGVDCEPEDVRQAHCLCDQDTGYVCKKCSAQAEAT